MNMESFFNRKKSRAQLRQASVSSQDLNDYSVPYDQLGASPAPPMKSTPGHRGPSNISAPLTNPTLTSGGTELNKFALRRSKADKDRTYADHSHGYTNSPSPSTSVANDSFILRQSRRSDVASTTSSFADFGQIPAHDYSVNKSIPAAEHRPMSGMSARSEANLGTKHASIFSTESRSYNSPTSPLSHFHLHVRHSNVDDFFFPRPDTEEEIEALFDNVKRTRDIPDMPNLSLDQKWHMVYNDEHIRWKEREDQAKKHTLTGQASSLSEGSPEWFIKKFLDKTITSKQAGSLLVSLRSREMSWFQSFVSLRGTSVLAQTLMHISRKGSHRRDSDITLEYEVVKCLRQILNNQAATKEALTHQSLVTQIASSLNTAHLPTRKLLLELLCFLVYWNDGQAHPLVVSALEALSASNTESNGCYHFWFKSLESTLSGRGKMGSLVGASDEIRKAGGIDSSLNDYTLSNLLLINGILYGVDDLDMRVHYRSQMEASGLQRIVKFCSSFGVSAIDKQLGILQAVLKEDERRLREHMDLEILHDLSNLEDVYSAIRSKIDDTEASKYFLSILQHILLIHEEGQALAHYYRLIDSLITDLVLDKKLGSAEQRLGHSVERIIALFNEADRSQQAEQEAAEARALALRFKLEKDVLEQEVAQGHEGLVGKLKEQLSHLEQKLNITRETNSKLQGQLETQKHGYEERIHELETQIMELFRMLKEVGVGVDHDTAQNLDRKNLVLALEKQFQRSETINILEGKDRNQAFSKSQNVPTTLNYGTATQVMVNVEGSILNKATRISEGMAGRTSQFMDADETAVQEQIQQQLQAGVITYVRQDDPPSSSRNVRCSPGRTNASFSHQSTFTSLRPHMNHLNEDFTGEISSYVEGQENQAVHSDSGIIHPQERTTTLANSRPISSNDEISHYPADNLPLAVAGSRNSIGLTDASTPKMFPSTPSEGQLMITSASACAIPSSSIHPPPPPPVAPPAPPPAPPRPPPLPPQASRALTKVSSQRPPSTSLLPSKTLVESIGLRSSAPSPFEHYSSGSTEPQSISNGSHAAALLGASIHVLLSARKDLPITPTTKMKQLQWDKLPQQHVSKTLWKDEKPQQEQEMLNKLQLDGVWTEIEEDFKAKQLVVNLMVRQKRAELKSILDPQTKKHVEILLQRVKKLQPEEIAKRIQDFDQDLCTQVFLSELKAVLPTPEQVGKLNVYRHSDAEELATLHPSDRLMVQLIKINRLRPRIDGMLYKCAFEETWSLLSEGAKKLSAAGQCLLRAQCFKELLSLILLIGNYMNGTGVKGGAYGFRVSSINKLVDTKSVNNTTLLHFLERTVAKHFPDMETFLQELSIPAEAYRVNLQDVRKGLFELREGLKKIRPELETHFSNIDECELYGTQMWKFVTNAGQLLEDLVDDVNLAETTFSEVVRYYGEDDKSMSSSEFYGIFKTFVTSYKKCKVENIATAEERLAEQKRKRITEGSISDHQKIVRGAAAQENDDTSILDNLLEKLRNGDNIGRRPRRARPTVVENGAVYSIPANDNSWSGPGSDAAEVARDMLARLQSDGFQTFAPKTPPLADSQLNGQRVENSQLVQLQLVTSANDIGEIPTGSFEVSDEKAL